MTYAAAFLHQSWAQGNHELGIEVGSTEDSDVQAVLGAVWAAAGVQGCYGRRDREPEQQEPVPCTVASLAEFGHLYGRVLLPSGDLVACEVMAIRGGDDSSDWVDFGVPLSALDAVGVVYSDDRTLCRSAVMDDWLAGIAVEAFRHAPFSLGAVGWNISGLTAAAELGGVMPEKRGMGYLLPRDGVLHYGAAND